MRGRLSRESPRPIGCGKWRRWDAAAFVPLGTSALRAEPFPLLHIPPAASQSVHTLRNLTRLRRMPNHACRMPPPLQTPPARAHTLVTHPQPSAQTHPPFRPLIGLPEVARNFFPRRSIGSGNLRLVLKISALFSKSEACSRAVRLVPARTSLSWRRQACPAQNKLVLLRTSHTPPEPIDRRGVKPHPPSHTRQTRPHIRPARALGYLGTPCRALPASTHPSCHQTRHSAFVIRHSCLWVVQRFQRCPSIFYNSLLPPTTSCHRPAGSAAGRCKTPDASAPTARCPRPAALPHPTHHGPFASQRDAR